MAKEITAEMIKDLRERTGVGIGKCKEALTEADGDMEKAILFLRKQGMVSAVKKEGRATNEGQIGFAESSDLLAIAEVNTETDFVVKNQRFQDFVLKISQEIAATRPSSLENFLKQKYSQDHSMTIEEYRASLVQTIGENIQIRRIKTFKKNGNLSLGVYSHLGGKILVVVEVEGSDTESDFARDIAMHIAAASPEYLSPEQVPEQVIENEREVARTQVKGKPPQIVDKIIAGKLESFYDAYCLLRQKFIRDDSLSVWELVQKRAKEIGLPLKITGFTRWTIGQT